jgi:nucleotide-binding universal stress UspA family protein
MYKTILLPLDGSALAEEALPHAVAHTEHFQAELILLKVLEPLSKHHSISLEAAWRAEKATRELAHEYLERIAAGVREKGVPVRVITVEGNPHEGIVSCAEAEQVDLIVICTRGHSGLTRWLMGSVADRVVRGASVPVLLVSAGQE